jgi:hypothetical protein
VRDVGQDDRIVEEWRLAAIILSILFILSWNFGSTDWRRAEHLRAAGRVAHRRGELREPFSIQGVV